MKVMTYLFKIIWPLTLFFYMPMLMVKSQAFASTSFVSAKVNFIKEKQALPKSEKKEIRVQSKLDEELRSLKENNEKMAKLLEARSNIPFIWSPKKPTLTGKTYFGRVLNSIVSTNLSSPVLVEINEGQGLARGSYFSCQGNTQHKRMHAFCHKLITNNKEVAVNTQLLNLDGTAGLVGEFDDGKEELVAGAILAGAASGVLSMAQDRVNTPFGEARSNSSKNQLYQGAIGAGQTVSDLLLDEFKRTEPIVTIDAGKPVIIYYLEASHE
jgi:hypothetical protein